MLRPRRRTDAAQWRARNVGSSLHRDFGKDAGSGDMHVDGLHILWRRGEDSGEDLGVSGLEEIVRQSGGADADAILTASHQITFLLAGGDVHAVNAELLGRLVLLGGGVVDPVGEQVADLDLLLSGVVLQAELHRQSAATGRDAVQRALGVLVLPRLMLSD